MTIIQNLYHFGWVQGLGVHSKNLDSILDSIVFAFSVDCHDLLRKSRNDDSLDSKSNLETHKDFKHILESSLKDSI